MLRNTHTRSSGGREGGGSREAIPITLALCTENRQNLDAHRNFHAVMPREYEHATIWRKFSVAGRPPRTCASSLLQQPAAPTGDLCCGNESSAPGHFGPARCGHGLVNADTRVVCSLCPTQQGPERERNDKQCLERVPLPKCPTECGQGRKASLPGHVPLALASSGPCHCGAISGPCPALQPNFGIRRPWANARTPISSAYKLTQHQWARESHHIGLALAVVLGRRQLCSPPAIFTWRRKSRVGCAPPAKEVDIC